MKVAWIPIGDRNTPSTRIMCMNVSDWMNKNGIESKIVSPHSALSDFDRIIFQKKFDEGMDHVARFWKKRHKQIIYIIDDLYVEGIKMAQIADKVVCGSDYIRDWIAPNTKAELFIIDDAYETSRDLYKTIYRKSEPLKVGWIGTLLHFPQAEAIRPLVEDLDYVYETITASPQATHLWSLDTVWQYWLDFDIMIIPFLGELPPYELAKGNNRLTQSMVLGVPVVTSPIPAYIPIIRNGKNGYICYNNTAEEFKRYLTLLKDHDFRINMSRQAREDVADIYNIDNIGRNWRAILNAPITKN